jgi:hypothetical protein
MFVAIKPGEMALLKIFGLVLAYNMVIKCSMALEIP